MRGIVGGVLSVALVVAFAGSSAARDHRPKYLGYRDNSPVAVALRQRHAHTFDETKYYEHDRTKIPLGTRAWWDQYDRERGGGGRQ
jgi:hypothetical protein